MSAHASAAAGLGTHRSRPQRAHIAAPLNHLPQRQPSEDEQQHLQRQHRCHCALPFLFLPGLGAALTHVRPTGYNKNGKCMRKLTGSQRKQKKAAAAAAASAHREEQERVLAELADRRSARRSEPVRDPDAPPPRPRRCSTEPSLATAERSRSDPSRSRSHRPTREVPPAAEPHDGKRQHSRTRSETVAEPYARSAKW